MSEFFKQYESKEIEIDGKSFSINKLMTEFSYGLYTEAMNIMGAVMNKGASDFSEVINSITNALTYKKALLYVSKGVTYRGKALDEQTINSLGAPVLIELLMHVINHNIVDTLGKLDLEGILTRLFPQAKDAIKSALPSTSPSSTSPMNTN
ncbi:hypothetical protein [Piscirickettsia litoralis]|uniref:Uncharacterized protein n=1 Tax=Piscirickettsia litoralis TaxID=1891921 RepID=A0ABX2ZXY6_9GAMM|nr:hypothetical protein [Piscirickettsia litoralis]ODN41244.1 hypothetical protein BGC07_17675 [Piscirickettsia litoralis]